MTLYMRSFRIRAVTFDELEATHGRFVSQRCPGVPRYVMENMAGIGSLLSVRLGLMDWWRFGEMALGG
jgi:hypothetical protein